MEKRKRTRLATAGLLALVFTTGSLVGVAVQRGAGGGAAAAEPPVATGGTPVETEPRRVPMYAQVGMSEEQLAQAETLVSRHRGVYRSFYEDYQKDRDSIVAATGRDREWRQQADSLVANIREQLKVIMTPEQTIMYDSLLDQSDRARAERQREGRSDDRRD